MIICDYLLLFMITCDVVCINANIGQLFVVKYLKRLIWLIQIQIFTVNTNTLF